MMPEAYLALTLREVLVLTGHAVDGPVEISTITAALETVARTIAAARERDQMRARAWLAERFEVDDER